MVLDGCYGQKWPNNLFHYAPSASRPYISQRERSVAMCSKKVPFTTLGHSQHLSHLQSIVDRPINTMLSLREMGEWLLERSIARDQPPEDSTPVKKVAVKKVDSIIHRERSPRSRKDGMRKDEMRKVGNEERRPRNLRLYRRPDFRPPYGRTDF
ncbi:hypothetical protein TNCV_4693601 [Trichonephila clavipes]|uniref:Uncharacterized protein n=1 Tax=Trichonephila clavipes TaxID=2585209 RepID=A0A8X7BH52_TRICX|nr:hypothetical protein TNCV_4693601 [Trichonephila clavipes]